MKFSGVPVPELKAINCDLNHHGSNMIPQTTVSSFSFHSLNWDLQLHI